jgi:hypothetical protein
MHSVLAGALHLLGALQLSESKDHLKIFYSGVVLDLTFI